MEQIYLVGITKGLYITFRHFMINITLHILHLFNLAKKYSAAATIQYPDERKALAARWRSRHRLTKRPDGTPKCVACYMCETVCPTRCIRILAEEHPDPNIEKRPKIFEIDLLRCCFCGLCVEACPEDAIRMDTGKIEFSDYSRESFIYDIPRLLE